MGEYDFNLKTQKVRNGLAYIGVYVSKQLSDLIAKEAREMSEKTFVSYSKSDVVRSIISEHYQKKGVK